MSTSSELILRELSEAEFPRAVAAIRGALAEGVAPGMVAGLYSLARPAEIRVLAAGARRKIPSEQPMEPETVFDLASVSKVMATASLAAVLVERGWIGWSTPLEAFFPNASFRGITLRHLLSHTAGFIAWKPFWEELRHAFPERELSAVPVAERQAEMRRRVLAVAPEAAPGARCVYSDVSFLLLGFMLEEVTGMPLDRAVREFVWKPMGLEAAFYRRVTRPVAEARLESVAATEDCPWRGDVLQGQVHDDNTWAMGGYAGHAGAFGTVRDVLQFARQWMTGFVSARVRAEAWTRVCEPAGCERSLGWDTPSGADSSAGRYFPRGSVGHLGFTGTSLWIDPGAGLAVTLLTNRVHPSRENQRIRAFRPRFHDAIREDLGY
ncbi:MAG: beta-lactamase family protein [Oligoflexia bacterium]|nr:beta-lactamase family protein [Oligoflexia bacterium]